jgi:hypothetical protein
MAETMISVNCDIASLQKSRFETITGFIHVEFGTFAFPDRAWSDFVVVILGWWLEALGDLKLKQRAELRFMEGPYVMSVTKDDEMSYGIECIKNSLTRTTIWSGKIEQSQFAVQLAASASEVLEKCRENNWHSSDIDHLSEQWRIFINRTRNKRDS